MFSLRLLLQDSTASLSFGNFLLIGYLLIGKDIVKSRVSGCTWNYTGIKKCAVGIWGFRWRCQPHRRSHHGLCDTTTGIKTLLYRTLALRLVDLLLSIHCDLKVLLLIYNRYKRSVEQDLPALTLYIIMKILKKNCFYY